MADDEKQEAFASAVAREDERRRLAKEAHERHTAKVIETTNAGREAHRRAFSESEQGAVSAANAEAERIMRLPTPEALEEMGSVIGDPLKGPSS